MPHDSGGSESSLPEWLSSSSDTLREFARNPSGFVIGIVATWIVGGILLVGRTIVDAVLLAFDVVVNAFDAVAGVLVGALQSVGLPVLDLASGVSAFIVGLADPLGPLAPVVAGAVVTILIVGTFRFGKAILLEIPILGGFLEFLGVDL